MPEDCFDDHNDLYNPEYGNGCHDGYLPTGEVPPVDETAYFAMQAQLKETITTLDAQIRITTDPDTIASLNVQLNAAIENLATNYSYKNSEI